MVSILTSSAALLLYLGISIYYLSSISRQKDPKKSLILRLTAIAIGFHGISVYQLMFLEQGADLSINKVASLVMLVMNLLVLLSSLRKPLHNLFIFLYPLSIISILLTVLQKQPVFIDVSTGVVAHILLSILAYSLLTIATLQAVLLGWQDHRLKHHQLKGAVKLLPPLQTMEQLMFEILWAGVILLTLGIAVGFIYLDNIFAQQLVHKTVLSIVAWVVFAGLLLGRHSLGWRGNRAIKWILTGFCLLLLAYFGSKLVLEVILK